MTDAEKDARIAVLENVVATAAWWLDDPDHDNATRKIACAQALVLLRAALPTPEPVPVMRVVR